MIINFFLSTALAGVASGVLGYLSFDKFYYHTLRYSSPGSQLVYIVALLCLFAFGSAITVLGVFKGIDNLSEMIATVFAVLFLFSIPGIIMIFVLYVLVTTGQGEKVANLVSEAATPILGLVAGAAVSFGISAPELSPLEAIALQEVGTFFRILGTLFGGFIAAVIALVTKSTLAAAW